MAVVRRGAWVALRYVTTIFFLGVVAQFFLVGVGLFGMKDGATIDNAGSLDPHRGFGFILADGGALLMLVLVLLACRHLARYQGLDQSGWFFDGHWLLFATGILLHHQLTTASRAQWWMILVLALSGRLAHYAWTTGRHKEAAEAPAAVPIG